MSGFPAAREVSGDRSNCVQFGSPRQTRSPIGSALLVVALMVWLDAGATEFGLTRHPGGTAAASEMWDPTALARPGVDLIRNEPIITDEIDGVPYARPPGAWDVGVGTVNWPATPLTGRFLADGRVPQSRAARGAAGVPADHTPTGFLRGFWIPDDPSGLMGPVWYDFGFTARGFYRNDQRIEFTGQEETFGVEGSLRGLIGQDVGDIRTVVVAEFFLNQPFDRNILVDVPDRAAFAPNFQIEPFQISQLHVSGEYKNTRLTMGRFVTPFGRTYFPQYSNTLQDGPFIRTEAIRWRETGLLLEYEPGTLRTALALVNGGDGQDTNSSKALVARVGGDWDVFVAGASIKTQDGVGSEHQKVYNNHLGVDAAIRMGSYTLSGEVIYDQYGMRRPFPQSDIFWGRSIYHRDLNRGNLEPLDGVGWYVDLTRDGLYWQWSTSFGAFHPRAIGDRIHDKHVYRGVLKASRRVTPSVDLFGVALLENSLADTFDGRNRRGVDVTFGAQWVLP